MTERVRVSALTTSLVFCLFVCLFVFLASRRAGRADVAVDGAGVVGPGRGRGRRGAAFVVRQTGAVPHEPRRPNVHRTSRMGRFPLQVTARFFDPPIR